jgi:hypothetical protein
MRLKLRTFYKVSLDITFTFTARTKLKIQFSCLKQTFANEGTDENNEIAATFYLHGLSEWIKKLTIFDEKC